jgi:hypothetical protein
MVAQGKVWVIKVTVFTMKLEIITVLQDRQYLHVVVKKKVSFLVLLDL